MWARDYAIDMRLDPEDLKCIVERCDGANKKRKITPSIDTLLGNLTPKEAIPVTETITKSIQEAVKGLYGATPAKALPIMHWIAKHAERRHRFLCKGEAEAMPFPGAFPGDEVGKGNGNEENTDDDDGVDGGDEDDDVKVEKSNDDTIVMIDTGLSATSWHSRVYQYLVTKAMIGGCNDHLQDTFLAEKYLEGIDKASVAQPCRHPDHPGGLWR